MNRKITWLLCAILFVSACKEKEDDTPAPATVNTV
ncbi:MAG: hypothetical protein ACI9JN_000930, partial [Bacteroidia bacterium]